MMAVSEHNQNQIGRVADGMILPFLSFPWHLHTRTLPLVSRSAAKIVM